MNYKEGLMIATLSLTGRISRLEILKGTDCVCFQRIRFVSIYIEESVYILDSHLTLPLWKGLGEEVLSASFS